MKRPRMFDRAPPLLKAAWLAFIASSFTIRGASPSDIPETSMFPSGPYCGVYCLQRALRSVGQDVEIESLIEPQYIGSYDGSSMAELTRAAKDFGASAMPITGLTADALQHSDHPVILHVAGSSVSHVFNHWVLFLGMQDGQARIYDPPRAAATIPLARLMSISDGMGLVIRPIAAPQSRYGLHGWPWQPIGIVLFGLAMVLVHRASGGNFRRVAHRTSGLRRCRNLATNAALLVAVALFAGLIQDLTNAEGLLRNPAAASGVLNKFYPELVPETPIERVRELSASGQGIILDARINRAYLMGHIPNAINVPVTSGLFGHSESLEGRAKATPIVVYCQSDQCIWARDVAFRLTADGYEDVSVFSGGWQVWSLAEKEHE